MNKLLHTPLTVHNVELANRLVMPPMATGNDDKENKPQRVFTFILFQC